MSGNRAIVPFAFVALVASCKRTPPPPPPAPAPVVSAAVVAPPATRALVAIDRAPREGSAIVVATTLTFVADEDAHAVIALRPSEGAVVGHTKLAGRPGQMILTRAGELAVTLRDEHAVGFYAATDGGELIEKRRVAVADEPIGIARLPSGDDLVVVSGIGSALCRVGAGADSRCVPIAREPRAVTVTDDGASAVVAHASAGGASVVNLADASARIVDLGHAKFSSIPKADPSHDFPGLAIERANRFARQAYAAVRLDGGRILIPHALTAPGDLESTSSSGYGASGGSGTTFLIDETMKIFPVVEFEISALSAKLELETVVDLEKNHVRVLTSELSSAEGRCFLPRAMVGRADAVWVGCVGSREVQRYDMVKTRAVAAPARFAAAATALAFDASGGLLAFAQHERALHYFAEPGASAQRTPYAPTRTVAWGAIPAVEMASESAQRGRLLFHAARDERVSKDRRACATCHPDGRDDGLSWLTPDGPRQTIFLAGRLERRPPYGWHGKHASLTEHMKVTMKQLGGSGAPNDAYADLEAYLRALPPPPRAARPLTAEAELGKRLFASSETRCATCHAESQGFGGARAEDVASKSLRDTTKEFLVPSLRYVGDSAPYYHDGRYATLEELLRGADGKMGHTKHLSDAEVGALASYLKAL